MLDDGRDEERYLLSACLMGGPATYYAASALVEPEHFELAAHRAIWRAMGRVAEHGKPDPATVWLEMGEDQSLLSDAGGRSYLSLLSSAVVSPPHAPRYAQHVRDLAHQRDVRRVLQVAVDSETIDADAVAEALYQLSRPEHGGETMYSTLAELYQTLEENKPIKAYAYPWPMVQWCTRGMRAGWLCVWAGETSHGKTAAALAITEAALKQGARVLYVSLEMPAQDLALRMAQRAGLSTDRVYRGQPDGQDYAALLKLIGQEQMKRLRIEQAYRVEHLPGLVRRWRPDLVVVDHLQLLDIGRDTRLEGTTKNVWALKGLAQRYDIPILALSQLSRPQGQDRGDGRKPSLSRLRDSGAIEQDADQVVFVWRKRDENGQLDRIGQFLVSKSRAGHTGAVDFAFNGATQTFTLLGGQV